MLRDPRKRRAPVARARDAIDQSLPPGIETLTMVPRTTLVALAAQVDEVLAADVPGDFVECGVWRGGAAFVIADRIRRVGAAGRKVWLFDSFEGLPPPKPVDGERALAWARDTEGENYFDNCSASLEEVQEAAVALELSDYVRFSKGWFDATLPVERANIGTIAMLRIDADWYDSVRCCLDNLYDLVSPNGLIVLDDYYTWDGCTLAVHDFLSERKLPHRIERAGSAYFRKG